MPISDITPEMMREIILDHYSNPLHKGRPADESLYEKTHADSTNCIDDFDLFLRFDGDKVIDALWDGVACAISTASTDILCDRLIGMGKEEALHLSQRETAKIVCCLENINEELHHAIDMHSSTILSRHIELLLDYCTRFYERQFITRENINKTLLSRLEKLATQSISSGAFSNGIHPTPEYFAEKLNLSTAYFKDLLKFEKGQTLPEYFRFKQLELAKQMLIETNDSPAVIARRLGFPSVQFFTLVFKKITGVVPSEYKYARN